MQAFQRLLMRMIVSTIALAGCLTKVVDLTVFIFLVVELLIVVTCFMDS